MDVPQRVLLLYTFQIGEWVDLLLSGHLFHSIFVRDQEISTF